MQLVDARPQVASRSAVPLFGLLLLGALVAAGITAFDWLAVLPLFGLVFFALVVVRPAYGIALFLSTFLVTYPAALQGTGALTINNVLGGVFVILLTYKVYSEQDWWFLRCPELQLLAFIFVVFYLGDKMNGPDPHILALLGAIGAQSENLHTFVTRSIFTLFFVNFIRTRAHVVMIVVLAMAFMVISAMSGTWGVLHGGGLHGYRANTSVIQAAANPNRLAMFSIIPIAELWYLMRTIRKGLAAAAAPLVVLPLIVFLALAVFMTGSRSGLLGLCVCIGVIMWAEGMRFGQMAALAIAAILLLLLVIQFVPDKTYDRITNLPFTQSGETGNGSNSFQRRLYGWKMALTMFEQHPLIGIGIGNWALERFVTDPAHNDAAPHSSYILAVVEGGVLALGGFLMLLLRTWRNFLWVESEVAQPGHPLAEFGWVVRAVKINLVVLVFFALFADLFQYVILFWLVGLGVVMRRMVEQVARGDADEALAA